MNFDPYPVNSYVSIRHNFERQSSGQELDLFGINVIRSSFESQTKFIRIVCLISFSQLLCTTCLTLMFLHFGYWYETSKCMILIMLIPATLLLIILAWQLWTQHHQISVTSRAILLFIYSFLMVFVLANFVASFFQEHGVMVLTLSCFGVLSNIVYTCQSKFHFQGPKPIIATVCVISVGLRRMYQLDPVQILGPVTFSSLVSVYLILELYYAMKTMTGSDYILANLSLYTDLAYPIHGLHHVCELWDDIDNFPEYFNPDIN
ncbi:hypothetical protein CU098_011826 [Rhizopus stolonifer]|uniref:Uncharacterized protein n=1 Tax=Rhizopus stolonifer TaxID=4846 RepID=A0A367KQM9_RHIST|nr:hypothetical protein CU098_011826 [Rhizopus stolonifer]